MKNNYFKTQRIGLFIVFLAFLSLNGIAQTQQTTLPKDTLIKAAREIMLSTHFCALATIDSTGLPQVRTMNPFPLKR